MIFILFSTLLVLQSNPWIQFFLNLKFNGNPVCDRYTNQTAVPSQNPIVFEERDCVASMREAHIHSIVPQQFETIMHAHL
jgi:hypothetical protein